MKKLEKGLIDNEGIIVVHELHMGDHDGEDASHMPLNNIFIHMQKGMPFFRKWVLQLNFSEKSCYCTH